jgi:PAS domain S-box-containing protein
LTRDLDVDGLAKELGLDREGIDRRRKLFGLGIDDERRLAKIKPLVQACAPEMADSFFQHLSSFSKSPELAKDSELLKRAKALKEKHLVAAVQGDYGPAYVRERLELALLYDSAHVEVAPLNGAFRQLIDRLGERILEKSPDSAESKKAFTSLAKVLSFDLSFISEVLIYLRESTIRRLGQEASQYARSLIEASLDPLVTISADGKITDVNEATIAATGLPRERLIGTDFSSYFTEPAKAQEGYRQVFSRGLVRDYPLTIRHNSGRLTDVLYNATVYKDAAGNVVGAFAAARDVTAQKQASQYARSLIEASLDPLVTISPEGKITDVNEGSVKATGVPREKLIGTDCSSYFTEPAKAQEGYQQVFNKGFVTDYPLTIRHTSGRLLDVLYNASVYKDAAGNVLGVFAAARDVTAQKQASQYARSLIEASLDPLVTISPEGKITDVNDGSVKATGVPREKLIGTDFSNYFTEPEKAREGYQQVFNKGFVTDYPLTIRHTSGGVTSVLYNATVYKDAAGKVLGVFAAARDVTKQKEAEAEIAEQRKRELARLAELERFNRLTVGRELKMI